MRIAGAVSGVHGLGRHDHVCWVYQQPEEYAPAARRFLLDGLERGERLLCVGEIAIHTATEGESALPDADALVRSGRLDLLPLSDAYRQGDGGQLCVADQLRFYSTAVERALADGYTGLRVAAEVTELAADPAQWDTHVRWEHVADRFIASGPGMATMCAYRIDLLDERMLARVSEVHPLTGGTGPAAAFRVFFDADALVLCGDVDSFGVGRLVAVLRDAEVPAHVVTLDVSQLTFIDAAGSRALAGWGHELAATGRTLVLRGASRSLRRVWSLLQLDDAAQLR